MSENYFGRDNQKDEKYADLHASIMRIANKSAEQKPEPKGFKDISDQQAVLSVQDAYRQMIQKPEPEELKEGTALQVKMALSDAGLQGRWKNNRVYVKKKDVAKAEKALKGNVIYKGKPPMVVGEEISEGESPHPKGSKKYKAHMAAKHANMNEGDMKADKEAGIKWVDDPDWKKLHEMDLQMIKDFLKHKDENI
tara:strand:- start:3432 stop:4016 length:585 start_codon:yes stop_codon:yes gene_type:complete